MQTHIVVDCEASGPCPNFGSMISFGAVVVEPGVARGHRSETIEPYSDLFSAEAYAAIGMTREQHQATGRIRLADAMASFSDWLTSVAQDRAVFWSDNPAFDWQWINHGFAAAGMRNPFGFSARRIGDLYAGLRGNVRDTQSWKRLRRTEHDHDPLNDARGNAEAMIAFLEKHDQLKALVK